MTSAELESRVRDAIATYVAPLVEADGGTITLVSTAEDEVVVSLEGACLGCPARAITRDSVIAPLLAAELGRAVSVRLQ